MKKLKGIDGKLDEAWSLAVKLRAGMKCEFCKKTSALNSHHVYSRSNRSVRWDLSNGYCLCVGHHTFGNFSAHKSPIDFIEWMELDRGSEWLEALKIKSKQTIKWSKNEKEQILEALTSYINERL